MRRLDYSKFKEWLIVFGEALVICAVTIFSVAPVSCKITTQGIQLLTGDYEPPQLIDFTVVDSNTLRLFFSEKVNITGQVVSPVIEGLEDEFFSNEHSGTVDLSPALLNASGVNGTISATLKYSEDNYVDVILNEKMEVGKTYELYSTVKDETGNTLTFCVPFTGYNPRVPALIMTEIKTISDTSQNKTEKENGFFRNEYVELLCLTEGNLAGLELCSANDGEARKYNFPVLEVSAGEIIVVHLRLRGEGCISEEGDNLALATTSYTNPNVRDLWGTDTGTVLGNKTDILIIRNKPTGKIIDAVMYKDETVTEWPSKLIPYSLLLDECDSYDSGDIEQASLSTGLTATKNLHRSDALFLLEQLQNGQLELPVKNNPGLWEVGPASAGILQ